MTVQSLDKENFKDMKDIAIIKFTAPWCAPCKQLAPIYEEVSNEIKSNFFEVDIDKEQDIAKEFGVMSVPTIIILKQNSEVLRITGTMPKEQLKNKILSKIQ